MLLKARREFTLCFFLFTPLGMAGYAANVPAVSEDKQTTVSVAKEAAGENADQKAKSARGGQAVPGSAAGGLSSVERVSRLMMDGRRAFQDGELNTARTYFRDALNLDSKNEEAQRMLGEIDRKSTGAKFAPEGELAEIPAGKAKVVKVATPASVTQGFESTGKKTVVSNGASQSLDNKKTFSMAGSVEVNLKDDLKTGKRLASESKDAVKEMLSSAAAGVEKLSEVKETKEIAAATPVEAKKQSTESVDSAMLKEAEAQKAKLEKAEADAAAKKEAAAKKVEEAKAKEEERKAELARKEEERKAEAAKKAEEIKAREAARVAKAEEEKRVKEEAKAKAAEEAKKLAEQKAAEEKAAKEESARKAAEALEAKREEKKKFEAAASETNAAIKLYNSGKYEEAHQKLSEVLKGQPEYNEAKKYLDRADKKIEAAKADEAKKVAEAKADTNAPIFDLDKLTDGLKEVAQASGTEAVAKASEKKEEAKSVEAKGDAAPAATPAVEEKKDEKPKDPIAAADLLVREANRAFADGKPEEALSKAKQAVELDPKNVEAQSLVKDFTSSSALPALAANATSESKVVASGEAQTTPPNGLASLLLEGKNKFESGQYREARTSFEAALDMEPGNAEAKSYIAKIQLAVTGEGSSAISVVAQAQDAETAFQQGLVAYQAGRLEVAVQHWNYALTLDANHPRAIQYLEQTKGEYEAWVQQHQHNAIELQKEVSATDKLESAIVYDTVGQKTLFEFLSAMSLITDINFYIANGVDADLRVTAKFDQKPLQDVLDIVLLPIGLKWTRQGDVITVTTDLRHKYFNLTPEQVAKLKPMLENKSIQRILYGPEGVPPMRNVELLLDQQQNMLIVTDSQENLNKLESYLKDLQIDAPKDLIYKNWKVKPEEGQRIKSLVEAIVKVNSDSPYDLERKVAIDGEDLIVKDTAENVAKIEQLLMDKNYLKKLETQELTVRTFSLVPRDSIATENVEQVRDLAESIVTVVRTILYSQIGETAASAQGRRYWFDRNTLQLTITDIPENIKVVADYVNSLPMLGNSKSQSEIIMLKHQIAQDMSGLLNQVLGLTGNGPGGGSTGQSITRTLRVEQELTFYDLRIRVKKIEGTDDDSADSDRSVDLIIRTATTSDNRTIEEFESDFVDDYEINVLQIRPSGMGDGQGSVKLEVRYNAAGALAAGGLGGLGGVPTGVPGMPGTPGGMPGVGGMPTGIGANSLSAIDDSGNATLVIEPVNNMNAILVRYKDVADLDQVRSWLTQLDTPIKQVSIETKLVEVNETRAKEFMPEFNWANIGQGSPDFSNNTNFFDFAKSEALGEGGRSVFDGFANDQFNNSLMKGSSVFSIITGGASPINFTLRALESEGVLNMVNGPTVTTENGSSAEFKIFRDFGLQVSETGGSGSSERRQMARLDSVRMEVTPQITETGEIRLSIDNLKLNDFGNQIGNLFPMIVGRNTFDNVDSNNGSEASVFSGTPYEVRRRELNTVARVRNHGTIVLGGWTGERTRNSDSGVPVLRNIPYVGKLLFGRTSDKIDRTNLLIFLTCHLVEP